jgi:hypothetical protein
VGAYVHARVRGKSMLSKLRTAVRPGHLRELKKNALPKQRIF